MIDLRGGGSIRVNPGERSMALRDEALYGNVYLQDLQQKRLIRRVSAKMAEVIREEKGDGGSEMDPRVADLVRADGLGPKLAFELLDRGIASLRDLLEAKREALTAVSGIGASNLDAILMSAIHLEGGELMAIDGLGAKLALELARRRTWTAAAVAEMTPEALAEIDGISKESAKKIRADATKKTKEKTKAKKKSS